MDWLNKLNRAGNSLDVAFFPIPKLKSLIKSWKPPRSCKTERDFQNSLEKYLKSKLIHKIKKEKKLMRRLYGDIVVGRTIIELKANFKTTSQLDRTIGQLSRYKKIGWEIENIIILVVNVIDEDLYKQLNKVSRGFSSKEVIVMKK